MINMKSYSQLAIGTVQFGLPYGIANLQGQLNAQEAAAIIHRAWDLGINTLDTAIAYGNSEQRLGEIGVKSWQVVTKLPAIKEIPSDISGWVQESVDGSLNRLKIPQLYGLILHQANDLLSPQGEKIYQALQKLKQEGKIKKIGVSLYDPAELDQLCQHFSFDLVQAPYNLIDRRLATSGHMNRLFSAGVEIHVRSIFLQGLLLMPPKNRPARFQRWQQTWKQWDQWLENTATTPLQACLNFAMSAPEISRIVVGVDGLTQFKEIIASFDYQHSMHSLPFNSPAPIGSNDIDLINPSRWNNL